MVSHAWLDVTVQAQLAPALTGIADGPPVAVTFMLVCGTVMAQFAAGVGAVGEPPPHAVARKGSKTIAIVRRRMWASGLQNEIKGTDLSLVLLVRIG
jgi:hypothetical protein